MPVTLVCAMSVDGKIAPVDRSAPRFGAADAAHLERLCAGADALVFGAGTLRAYGTTFRVRNRDLLEQRAVAGLPAQPLSCVVTRRGDLDPALPFFRQDVPRTIATTDAAAARCRERFAGLARIWGCGADQVEPRRLLARLDEAGHHEVLLLGGGQLNAQWLEAGLVSRLELTVAPVLFGGAAAPTWLDGPGLPRPLAVALRGCAEQAGCLFLSYDLEV